MGRKGKERKGKGGDTHVMNRRKVLNDIIISIEELDLYCVLPAL